MQTFPRNVCTEPGSGSTDSVQTFPRNVCTESQNFAFWKYVNPKLGFQVILCKHFQEMSAQSQGLWGSTPEQDKRQIACQKPPSPNAPNSTFRILFIHNSTFGTVTFDDTRIFNTVVTWSTF